MPKLPQLNIRLPLELHDLVRELAQRLRADPSLAVRLESLLVQASDQAPPDRWQGVPPQDSPIALGLADDVADLRVRIALLPEILERLTRAEETTRKVMDFAKSINEGVVKDRQARAAIPSDPASTSDSPGASPTETSEPLVTGGEGTRRRLTPAGIAEVERLIRAKVSDAEIAGRVGMDRGAIRQRRLKLTSPQEGA
jgi:hypothetical protein